MTRQIRIGTAGWSVSRALEGFPEAGTSLERYAARFNAVEINSSFYRPHQRKTYERWTATTPADFRFAVKVPKTITHERRLVDCAEPLARFLGECAGLGDKLGPLLIQLPPSLRFEPDVAERFLTGWRSATAGATVLEPRHASGSRPPPRLCSNAPRSPGSEPIPPWSLTPPSRAAGPAWPIVACTARR